ncbi:MAG: sigma-70 family RNA polymerase sigma factor [Byssovorax sp.]
MSEVLRTLSAEESLILALPAARRLAHSIARSLGVRLPHVLEDCEQAGALAMVEVAPRHDQTRGDLFTFAWKRIAGAVTELVCGQTPVERSGQIAVLEAAAELRDTTDPFAAFDEDDKAKLKEYCRWLTFKRLTAETHARLRAPGADVALVRARAFNALETVLGELNDQDRRFIELRHIESLKWDDVAQEMGVDTRQAQRIEERLRGLLRRNLRLQGVNEPPPSER